MNHPPSWTTRIAAPLVLATVIQVAASAATQGAIQSERLVATSLSLGASPKTSALAGIWQDRLRAEQAKLASLPKGAVSAGTPSVPVFVATFKDGARTIIISALFTTPECRNFSGAASPALNNCPMRVAVLRDEQVRVVASVEDFPFVAAMKETSDAEPTQYDNQSERDRTIVTFNPATREIATSLTLKGVLDAEKSPSIYFPTD
jgi:hypothetical protein